MMPADTVEFLGNSLIQHGPFNQRIYVLQLDPWDIPYTIQALDDLAGRNGYSKIIVKVPEYQREFFSCNGYETEAIVPDFFCGLTPGYFMGKFRDPSRKSRENPGKIDEILSVCRNTSTPKTEREIPAGMEIRESRPDDAENLAMLYQAVFETYPFPISDPEFLRHGMAADTRYFQVTNTGSVIAASSFEISRIARNSEMTDIAVIPDYRGIGLSHLLLERMEKEACREGIILAYTICRAMNLPVNRLFSGTGYSYGGTLVGNTNICGGFESMNVWYKKLATAPPNSGERMP